MLFTFLFQLLKLLKTIMENREEMPCFDPREVMILTNQWDAIENDDSSSDEDEDGKSKKEDQHAETWKLIQRKFENAWCSFDVEKVFRVSLTQVYTFFSQCAISLCTIICCNKTLFFSSSLVSR